MGTLKPEGAAQTRHPGRLTGEKLGNKVELAQELLTSGYTHRQWARPCERVVRGETCCIRASRTGGGAKSLGAGV